MFLLVLIGMLIFFVGLIIFGFSLIKGAVNLLALLWYIITDIPMLFKHRKSQYFIEETRKKVEEQQNIEQMQENARRQIVLGAMNFVTKMRVMYPLADEKYFKEAYDMLPKPSCELTPKDYEKIIAESHQVNLKKQKTVRSANKMFTLADLDNKTPIEVRQENPIIMKLYKINDQYVLWVNNMNNKENSLFQSEDYALMANYMLSVVELQQQLHHAKISVVASQLEDIFNEKYQVYSDVAVKRNNLFG